MQPRKPLSLVVEWEEVSISSIEEILPPYGEAVVDPSGLFPTRFGDPSPEYVDAVQRHDLAHSGTVSASLPGPGDWIADTYRLETELGGGSMGVVYTALDKALERKVAIKLI